MSPWSRTDAEAADEEALLSSPQAPFDESFERELFARRARALPAPVVPPLAAVMRLSKVQPVPAVIRPRRPGGRVVEVLLAVACVAVALAKLPRPGPDQAKPIVADVDAGATAPLLVGGYSSADECPMSDDMFASEGRACFAPEPAASPVPLPVVPDQPCTGTGTGTMTVTGGRTAPEEPPHDECTAEESCAVPSR